jgi:hypothetical protein
MWLSLGTEDGAPTAHRGAKRTEVQSPSETCERRSPTCRAGSGSSTGRAPPPAPADAPGTRGFAGKTPRTPLDRCPPSCTGTPGPGACLQVRHKPLSVPTAVSQGRSSRCGITVHRSAGSPNHLPESIQRTPKLRLLCKRASVALRTADGPPQGLKIPGDRHRVCAAPPGIRVQRRPGGEGKGPMALIGCARLFSPD